jgi:hypothetical protein
MTEVLTKQQEIKKNAETTRSATSAPLAALFFFNDRGKESMKKSSIAAYRTLGSKGGSLNSKTGTALVAIGPGRLDYV